MIKKDLETFQNSKYVTRLIFLGLFIALIYMLVCIYQDKKIEELTVDYILGDPEEYLYAIDTYTCNESAGLFDTMLSVSGWIIKPGTEMESVCIHVVVEDNATGKKWVLPSIVQDRPAITDMINDGVNYNTCGFVGNATRFFSKFSSDSSIYILYELNGENILIETGIYLEG